MYEDTDYRKRQIFVCSSTECENYGTHYKEQPCSICKRNNYRYMTDSRDFYTTKETEKETAYKIMMMADRYGYNLEE